MTSTDRSNLLRLAAETDRKRWQALADENKPLATVSGSFIVCHVSRLTNRPMHSRAAAGYFAADARTASVRHAVQAEAGRQAVPHYTIVDLGQRGVRQAYVKPAVTGAEVSFAAMALQAVSCLRRWHALADSEPLPQALPLRHASYVQCLRCGQNAYAAGLGCERCSAYPAA